MTWPTSHVRTIALLAAAFALECASLPRCYSATHKQVLDAITAKLNSFPDGGTKADSAEILKFLRAIPELTGAQISSDSSAIWASFTADGRSVAIDLSQPAPAPPATSALPATPPAYFRWSPRHGQPAITPGGRLVDTAFELRQQAPQFPQALATQEIPNSSQVRILTVFLEYPGTTVLYQKLLTWLTNEGYQLPTVYGAATVGDLKNVGGDGVLYFDSHSVAATDKHPPGIWTTEQVADDAGELYGDDLDGVNKAGPKGPSRLFYQDAKTWSTTLKNWTFEAHYAITPDFINTYWQNFADNSLVYISACQLAGPAFQPFVNAFFAKNASVYLGWSSYVDAEFAANTDLLLFERLIGPSRNDEVYPEADGFAQRPFPLQDALQDEALHGLGATPYAALTPLINPNAKTLFGLLAPTIKNVAADEYLDQLEIWGIFGDVAGTVTVGNKELQGCQWGDSVITCNLPESGDGSEGEVVVTVQGHKSNAAMLTSWRGSFHFTVKGADSLTQDVVYNLHFRIDLRQFRAVIHNPPLEPITGALLAKDAQGKYTCSGTATQTTSVGETTYTMTFKWDGGGGLAAPIPGTTDNYINFTIGAYTGTPPPSSHNRLDLHLDTGASQGCAYTVTDSSGTVEPGTMSVMGPFPYFGLISLSLDESAVIAAGNFNVSSLQTAGPQPSGTGTQATVAWQSIKPEYPPDPNSAR